MSDPTDPTDALDLVLVRILDAPRQAVFRAWCDPTLLSQWWAPAAFGTTPRCEIDMRSGGVFRTVMRATADGAEHPNQGVFLEVVKDEKIVFTDAYVEAWIPSPKPFMTVIITLEDAEGGKTKYTARVRHWTVEDARMHAQMGFHESWSVVAEQLEKVAAAL